MIITAKSAEHSEIRARDGSVGKIRDLYFDDQLWRVRYVVVDTGSWLTGRTVLIAPGAISSADWQQSSLAVNLTKDQVRNSPHVDTQRPVSRQYETSLHDYYGWPYYWAGPAAGAAYGAPIAPVPAPLAGVPRPAASEQPQDRDKPGREHSASEGDPHLRSVHAVRGSHLAAIDGSIGHVEDFLLDDSGWMLPYLIVDTRNWLPGKKVAVPVSAVGGIDWLGSTVRIELTRDAICNGPEFQETRPLAVDYTDRLEAHYRRPGSGRAGTE